MIVFEEFKRVHEVAADAWDGPDNIVRGVVRHALSAPPKPVAVEVNQTVVDEVIPEPDHVLTVLVDPDGGTGLLAVAEESEIGALWNVDPGVRIDAGDPFEAAEEVF
ncbi:hypothetical protein [Haloquadratum walsbyi]|jgi:hypothetical protein|uniref:Uncharacterized protein n=1 Tax=Haloquadratum walsbyi (strain DSM 16854 / JCM 12705 / C23) TaxID=768065 RepID=G0LJP9_HALWC|nr:hypothetical protein [Haloquadratum walsbyi]CCC40983.1 uncharacterized protein Hqrw_3202 [Haloquadratum walsbyi C23]